jgi:hypothetical protein
VLVWVRASIWQAGRLRPGTCLPEPPGKQRRAAAAACMHAGR